MNPQRILGPMIDQTAVEPLAWNYDSGFVKLLEVGIYHF